MYIVIDGVSIKRKVVMAVHQIRIPVDTPFYDRCKNTGKTWMELLEYGVIKSEEDEMSDEELNKKESL